MPHPTTVDFETDGIMDRPDHPPLPVGVSIKDWGKPPKYYAFEHTSGNNCTKTDAVRALKAAWKNPDGIICHNGKFDVEVGVAHCGLPMLPWDKIHDTLFLMFLDNPHQTDLGLKVGAQVYLGEAPSEKDAMEDWMLQHQPVPGVKVSKAKKSEHYYMKYLRHAPGTIVGPYANGDSHRSEKMFKLLYPKIVEAGMLDAYNRERRMMPIMLANEQQGVRVNLVKLAADVKRYNAIRDTIDNWIRKRLKTPDLKITSGDQLVEALLKTGKADLQLLGMTEKGSVQTNKAAIERGVSDLPLASALRYRAQLSTCIGTFMEPWLLVAEKTNGIIHTSWNQTRATDSGTGVGARTGRLSGSPNFMNIPNEFKDLWWSVKNKKLPKCPFPDLPPLPMCRGYIIPLEKDHVLFDRDYSQQEPRILAHFENGRLLESYLENPWMDVHDSAQAELAKMGLHYERKPVKNTNLGLIYGMGVGKLAEKNDMTVDDSKALKNAVLELYPGLKEMYKDMRRRGNPSVNEPIRTWGGRLYYCEPPKLIDGRMRTFDYKLVNQLIQGSAADCTKESIIRYNDVKKDSDHFLLTVHDQNVCSAPAKDLKPAMKRLQDAMESIEFDVPMLSEGSWSKTNWAEMKPFDKRGKVVYA